MKILNEYNPNKKHKILIVFYDIIPDTLSNKNNLKNNQRRLPIKKKQIDAIMNQKKTLHLINDEKQFIIEKKINLWQVCWKKQKIFRIKQKLVLLV